MDEEGWQLFLQICQKSKNRERLSDVFHLFLTSEERSAISKRTLIVKELLKGKKTQRKMAKELKVSIAKITRGSNELKLIEQELKEFLKKGL